MAVLEFAGTVENLGQSRGHYTCDVKDKERKCFRTKFQLKQGMSLKFHMWFCIKEYHLNKSFVAIRKGYLS